MAIWTYVLLFFAVIGGGGLAFYMKSQQQQLLKLILSFSGAYILGISVLHLMPTVFSTHEIQVSYWVLAGFVLQLFLEQLSRGVEHGHLHASHQPNMRFAFQIMLGLSLHALIEGLPLSAYPEIHHNHQEGHGHNPLLIGVILHKAPAAFALVTLLLISRFSYSFTLTCLIIFALMSPLGAWIGSNFVLNQENFVLLLAFVVGAFLHISTTILFESDDNHQHHISWRKFGIIILALGVSFLSI